MILCYELHIFKFIDYTHFKLGVFIRLNKFDVLRIGNTYTSILFILKY